MSPNSAELRDRIMNNADLPFTSGHQKWLAEGGVVTPAAFKRVIDVQFKDYFKTDRSDGSGRLRASNFSSVGTATIEDCDRMHILSFLGVSQDPRDGGEIEIMNTGTQLHYYLQQAGLSGGWIADIEVPVYYEPWLLRGSMDGLLADGTGLEIKTTGSHIFTRVINKWKGLEEAKKPTWRAGSLSHLWQVHMYMQAHGLEKFSLVYIDRGYPNKFLELRVPRDEDIMADVTATMDRLMGYISAQQLPPMLVDCEHQKGATYDSCNYRTQCPLVKGFK